MNDNLSEIFNEAKQNSLTDSERALMRNNVRLYMHEHPARAPLSVRIRERTSAFVAVFDLASRSRLVPAVLTLVLAVGVGTSYAAENALPGDPLYAVKIYLNENRKGSFAVSEASKAEWNTTLMTRRLEEAETLTSQDRLTTVARADIQTQLLRSAEKFDKNVEALARTDDAIAVATVQSNLEASLEAHVQVLAALTSDVPGIQSPAEPIIEAATLQAQDSAAERSSAEAAIEHSDDPTVMTAAFSKKDDATEAVMTVRAAAANETEATTSVRAAAKAAFQAERSISRGDSRLKRGEYAKAFTIFQAAIRTARSAQVHLDASARLNTDLPATTTEEYHFERD